MVKNCDIIIFIWLCIKLVCVNFIIVVLMIGNFVCFLYYVLKFVLFCDYFICWYLGLKVWYEVLGYCVINI